MRCVVYVRCELFVRCVVCVGRGHSMCLRSECRG